MPLCKALRELDVVLNIETSGAYPIHADLDWICVSPKRFKLPLDECLIKADELKMIVVNNQDLKWAEELSQKVKSDCLLLLQAEWSRAEKVHPRIIEFIKEHPEWKLSIQSHKFLNIP